MIHRIVITPSIDSNQAPRHNGRGALYDVTYNGISIVRASTEPCLDGARALKALGYSGKLELWDDITPYVRLTADIDKAAKKTIREGDEPPRLVKYVAFAPRSALDGDLALLGVPVAQTGKSRPTDSPRAPIGEMLAEPKI